MSSRKIICMALVMALVLSMSVVAFAADETYINTPDTDGSIPVQLTAEAATFSVTVPTVLPVSVAADGTITTADDAAVVNHSAGMVQVTDISITAAAGWTIGNYDELDVAALPVNSTTFGFSLNNETSTGDTEDSMTFDADNWAPLAASDGAEGGADELPFTYDAKVAARSEELTVESIADVVFTVGWYTGDATITD